MKCITPGCQVHISTEVTRCVSCTLALARDNNSAVTYSANMGALTDQIKDKPDESLNPSVTQTQLPMSVKYPKYYKPVGQLTEVDVYAVHHLFNIQDPSGAVQHASKKLLLSGVRTGGKSKQQDIREARDTLNRWLELNPER